MTTLLCSPLFSHFLSSLIDFFFFLIFSAVLYPPLVTSPLFSSQPLLYSALASSLILFSLISSLVLKGRYRLIHNLRHDNKKKDEIPLNILWNQPIVLSPSGSLSTSMKTFKGWFRWRLLPSCACCTPSWWFVPLHCVTGSQFERVPVGSGWTQQNWSQIQNQGGQWLLTNKYMPMISNLDNVMPDLLNEWIVTGKSNNVVTVKLCTLRWNNTLVSLTDYNKWTLLDIFIWCNRIINSLLFRWRVSLTASPRGWPMRPRI